MIRRKINLLVIEDEEFDVRRIRKTLKPFEDQIIIRDVFSNGKVALDHLKTSPERYDVIIMDFQIAGGLKGEALIHRIKQIDPTLQIIVVTKMTLNNTDFEFANRLLTAGAMWYCTKYPGDIEDAIYQPTDFVLSIYNACEKRRLEKQRMKSDQKLEKNVQKHLQDSQILGQSVYIRELKEQINKVAGSDSNVLIQGDSGTGKELVAAHIHYQSNRRFEEFVPVNCGSLPEHLIESELFGFEKGSFTGAQEKKLGLFEIAHKGTIFLDEVAELPLKTQATLLRVLQEGEIDKIGRSQRIDVDVRAVSATNSDLGQQVREGSFREDLYYRLNVVPITVRPLREHKDDIPLLLDHFLDRFSREMDKTKPVIPAPEMNLLMDYEWQGNIRELQNVTQRLLFFASQLVTAGEVEIALGRSHERGSTVGEENTLSIPLNESKILPWKIMEKNIRKAYFEFVRRHAGSDADAARKLGLAPPNYHRMCRELGLK